MLIVFGQQAEVARQQFIRSREEADQQKQLVEAEFAVKTAAERAKALVEIGDRAGAIGASPYRPPAG